MTGISRRLLIVAATATLALAGLAQADDSPAVGAAAPAFRLQDQAGKWHNLSDYKGKWVALYFYPKDDTPGCTTQACSFRDNVFAFNKEGAVILGISVDDVESHKAFAEKMRQAAEDAVSFEVEEDEYLKVGPPKVSVEIFSLPSGDIVGGTLHVHQTGVERPDDYYDNEDKYPEKKLKQMASETDVSWGMSGVYGNTPSGEIDRLRDPDYMEWSGY